MDYGKLCKEILDLDPKVRYAGVSDDTGETKFGGQREGVKNLLSSEETKKSNLQALARWALRNSLSPKVGKGRYAMAEYEKAKRITIPLEYNGCLLLITTEVDADHDRIIDYTLKLIQHSSDDRTSILKTQYDKLTDDWRSFNNLIWGVPTVAIAIMTGILIGAYHNLAPGTWERIASLGIGSIFLFALTIEIIKKRYHMNVISSLLKDLQVELGLEEKFRFPLGIDRDIDNYLARFTDYDKKRMFADYKHDPLFEFFRFSYARKYLTYVIFSAATILAILAEWEFIYHQKLGDWWTSAGTGIVVGIVAIVIPIVWYEKRKKEEKGTTKKK